MKKFLLIILLLFSFLGTISVYAQEVRTEIFVGNESPALDVFWVEPFSKGSPFLFLSRNSFTAPEYEKQPGQFSTLEVAAYQIKKTGLGIALAATATTTAPLQARAGVQFLKAKPKKWLLYTIASTQLDANADLRWLVIGQFTPKITDKTYLFTRAEWVSSIGYKDTHRFSASVLRLGLQRVKWQFGLGGDFLWLGKDVTLERRNLGVFLVHLF